MIVKRDLACLLAGPRLLFLTLPDLTPKASYTFERRVRDVFFDKHEIAVLVKSRVTLLDRADLKTILMELPVTPSATSLISVSGGLLLL
jgi:hypothetical protein